ncbi:PLP-dependent transferase [Myriangium duriaei CBS 260.36]|uniref:PLP-dependent transferase n=1 Tax=Myriangium duriaei CBS 260.36 TaxID=1168546 RepID=A0A9P4JDU4_9PEZI|nr:PLP-dependent transferase [Myriangium duriaei CBS 260.36]
MATNGTSLPSRHTSSRADEVDDLLTAVQQLIIPFIRAADSDADTKAHGHGQHIPSSSVPHTTLVEHHPPYKLASLFQLDLPSAPGGRDALLATVRDVLAYSVNTWDQGFLDKLYGATNAPGLAAEVLLAALNTNVHVYAVSPALTLVEKRVTARLAGMFGLGERAGGISQPGGSAGNATSIVVARNSLFPETKTKGLGGRRLVLFTSAHGHYSLEKAGQMFGFGSEAVRGVPVDEVGRMRVDELRRMIREAREEGEEPFYVNATAGTTVLGSFERFDEIADVCQEERLWMHVDGSWGGPVVFSRKHREKLKGAERADSIAVTPHKMLGVPLTCSFLLVKDLRKLHKAMTLPAGYLFHSSEEEDDDSAAQPGPANGDAHVPTDDDSPSEFWDLADLTPQCGRKGDALKLALGWIYYGSEGYERLVDNAFDTAAYMASQIEEKSGFDLVSQSPPPCWQVCFYFHRKEDAKEENSRTTETIARKLVNRGFMIDYAPGEKGKFFRVVVNGQTRKTTVDGILKAIEDIGTELGL